MTNQGSKELNAWVYFLSQVEIPVLKQTARRLSVLCEQPENLSARNIAQIIKSDPLMVVKLMRYLQHRKQRAQDHEIMEVEQVLMMLGIESALKKVPVTPLVEEVMGREHMGALLSLLKVTHRAKVASNYAFDWAVRLQDLHYEEVRIAALLHDIAEILMWCFSPKEMQFIKSLQKKDKTMRSHNAQEQVLGFTLHALQHALAKKWALPGLLIKLMDGDLTSQQRVQNVCLAVNLARHSANGWDDAALPDDYKEIGSLLHLQPEDVMKIVGANKQPSA